MNENKTSWDQFIGTVVPGSKYDKLIGMIYGHALGDAVGLQSEFKVANAETGIKFPYDRPIRDYPLCDWTDDTDHLILVMQSLIANKMKFNARDFAKRLKDWSCSGFPELGDTTGLGLGGTTNMVIIHPKFLEDPMKAATEVWTNAGRRIAPNGSLMRTSIIGTISLTDNPCMGCDNCIRSMAEALCKVTHADPRCIAACVFQSLAINKLVNDPSPNIDGLVDSCAHAAQKYVRGTTACAPPEVEKRIRGVPKSYVDTRFSDHEEEFLYWINMAYTSDIRALELDESVKIGFVFKCLSCSIFALQMISLAVKYKKRICFKKFIILLAGEAGDADTNCAVAGAIIGAHLGYSALPRDWIEALPNRTWLNNIIIDYVFALNIQQS